MSEEPHPEKSNQEEKKKTRRTRKDEEGRNFQCPCGKSYLSYPALYTHIKTKHQGKAPKEGDYPAPKPAPQEDYDQKDPLSSMRDLLNGEFPQDRLENSTLAQEESHLVAELRAAWQAEKELYLSDPSTHNPTASIALIFGKLLWEMQPKLKPRAYEYLEKFICAFHKEVTTEKSDANYCKNNDGSHLPYFFNELIVKSSLPSIEADQEREGTANTAFACKNLFLFGGWIFEQRFTNFSVKFNSN